MERANAGLVRDPTSEPRLTVNRPTKTYLLPLTVTRLVPRLNLTGGENGKALSRSSVLRTCSFDTEKSKVAASLVLSNELMKPLIAPRIAN